MHRTYGLQRLNERVHCCTKECRTQPSGSRHPCPLRDAFECVASRLTSASPTVHVFFPSLLLDLHVGSVSQKKVQSISFSFLFFPSRTLVSDRRVLNPAETNGENLPVLEGRGSQRTVWIRLGLLWTSLDGERNRMQPLSGPHSTRTVEQTRAPDVASNEKGSQSRRGERGRGPGKDGR